MTVISPPKVITISLGVQARELYELPYPPTLEEMNRLCILSDEMEHETPESKIPIEYFETIVERNQEVKWVGNNLLKDEKYTVQIESIVYDHTKKADIEIFDKANFFDRIAICTEDGTTVKSKVKSDIQKGEVWHLYWINFRITKLGEGYKNYTIDPRLKINN